MQKWEYLHVAVGEEDGKPAIKQMQGKNQKTLHPREESDFSYIAELVNTLGDMSWELVSAIAIQGEEMGILYIFKRPK